MSFTNHPADVVSQSVLNTIVEAMNKTPTDTSKITKGAFVIPNAGPHKGMRHKVTSVNEDGSMTITPWDLHPSKIQYRMGSAKATHDQLESIKEETIEEGVNTPSVKPYSHPGSSEQAGWKAMNKHGKTKFFRKESKTAAHRHAGIELNESEQLDEVLKRGSKPKTIAYTLGQEHPSIEKLKDRLLLAKEKRKTDADYHKSQTSNSEEEIRSKLAKLRIKHDGWKPPVNESEQLDELSQNKLGQYINKASTSAVKHEREGNTHSAIAKTLSSRDKESAMHHGHKAASAFVQLAKRRKGIQQAAGKL